jgi:hypothetical protein
MNTKHPLAEVFGFPSTDMSANANRHRTKRLCPFNNKVPNCTKDKAQAYMELDILRNPCGMVAGIYSEWQGKCKVAALLPRELIHEIMQQGYNRKIAVECAIQFRSKPPVLEKSEYIIVRWMGKEIAKLKPLKYFNMV